MGAVATEIARDDPYAGLRETSARCWRAFIQSIADYKRRDLHARGGGPGIFDDIGAFLNSLLALFNLQNVMWWFRYSLFQPVVRWFQEHIFEPIVERLSAAKDAVIAWLANRWAIFLSGLANVPSQIRAALQALPVNISNLFASIVAGLQTGIALALLPLQWLLSIIPPSIRQPITDAVGALWGHLQAVGNTVGGFLNSIGTWISTAIANAAAFLSSPLEGLRALWAQFQQTLPGQVFSRLSDVVMNFWNMLVAGLKQFAARVILLFADFGRMVIEDWIPFIEGLWAGFKTLPATFLEWAVTTAGDNLAMQPGRALATVGSLFAISIAAGSAAHGISTVLNLVPTQNWVGAAQFAGMIGEVAAFEPLTRATYGVLINEALATPIRYHFNQQLRPNLPTQGEIFTMGRKHGINRHEFDEAMSYMGLPAWWIDKMYDFFWTDPSPMWLLRMTEDGIPRLTDPGTKGPWLDEWLSGWQTDPQTWVKMKLMLAGYERTDVGPMIEGMTRRALKSPVTQFKTSVRAMVREGYWTESNAGAALSPLGVLPAEIHLIYLAEELDYQKAFLDDQVRLHKEAFRKGQIDEQDLTLALSTIYIRPDRVAQEVTRERVRALPKPKPLTAPKEDPLITSLRKQAITSWLQQYRKWAIDEQDLLLGLTLVVQDPTLAQALVKTERTRFRPAPPGPPPPKEDPVIASSRRQAIASWIKGFRAGEINHRELETFLAPLIPDAETRGQLVALEQLRYKPHPDLTPPVSEDPELARIRAEYVRGHIEMFQTRLIGVGQLYVFLLADGLVEELARATVVTQATRRLTIPKLESPYYLDDIIRELSASQLPEYERMYLEGRISLEQYVAFATTLTTDPELVTYLADLLDLRRFLERL